MTNAEGFTSAIVLSDRNQITELWHNQQRQAQIVYDDNGWPSRYDINGQPTALETLTQNDYQQYRYQYDEAGRIIAIDGSDQTQIRYVYDVRGNLTNRQIGSNSLAYTYAANGDIISEKKTQAGEATVMTYGYSPDGLLATLSEKQHTTHLGYNNMGKLASIVFPDGAHHQYRYDQLGFRVETQRSDTSHIGYRYDSLGNLSQLTETDINQQCYSQTLTLNEHNQLTALAITDQPLLTVKYTSKGNPKTVVRGHQTTVHRYDKLGRLTQVNDSEMGQSSYEYQPDEVDIRVQLDDRTRTVNSNLSKISSHNQSQSSLFYARQLGSPWQAVIWHQSLGKFVLPSPQEFHSSDSGYQSSKQRRRLYDAVAVTQAGQYHFDKASNSFFLPAEYQAANCYPTQTCFLADVTMTAPFSAQVGVSVTVDVNIGRKATLCKPKYTFQIDGAWPGIQNSTGVFTPIFNSTGLKQVRVLVNCEDCPGDAPIESVSQYVDVSASSASCPGSVDGIVDSSVKAVLSNYPRKPFEYGVAFVCVGLNNVPDVVEAQHLTNSFAFGQPLMDPCKVQLWNDKSSSIVGLAHTHPLFNTTLEYNRFDGCGGDKLPKSDFFLRERNEAGKYFSIGDKSVHPQAGTNSYLGTPFRDNVKVMREGSTVTEILP